MDALWRDIRLAVRTSLRQPGFSAIAILVLALGIGANTAIYTLVDAVALRPLPIASPQGLYRLGDTNACCVTTGLQGDTALFSYPAYRYLRDHGSPFASLAAFQANAMPLSVRHQGRAAGQPVVAEFVSASYFSTLGVPMAVGRGLEEGDDSPGAGPVAVVSDRAWRDWFGRASSVVGSTFVVSGQPVTIVGVTSPAFFGETIRPNPPDVWLPLGVEPLVRGVREGVVAGAGAAASLLARADQNWLYVVGRLRPGASVPTAQERISAAFRVWLADQPFLSTEDRAKLAQQQIVITSAATGLSRLRARYVDAVGVVAYVSALALLITCANLASLLLARTRSFQFALRAALGASRHRLARETLTSGLVLALAGGVAGVIVAYAGTRVLIAMAFRGAEYVPIDAAPSASVLGVAALVSLVAGVVFSAAPAWIVSRADPIAALRGGGRTAADPVAPLWQALVVLQIALSVVLVVSAGLLTRSLARLEHQEYGFQTEGRLIIQIDPALAGYTTERLPALYDRLYGELERVPGVSSVSLSQYSPMGGNHWTGSISLEGKAANESHRYSSAWLRVGRGYFETVGTPLIRGRVIDERDTATALHVAVVNRAFAARFFPGGDPIGRHVGLGEEPGRDMDYQIVGVVDDAKYTRADEPAGPTFFIPLFQTVSYGAEGLVSMQARSLFIRSIVLRVVGGARRLDSLQSDVRRVLTAVDPDLASSPILTFDEQLARNFNQQRLVARLTALYSQLALLLAAIGLYGVTSHQVARRTGEIGIRMALGADRRRVLGMVLRRALLQTILGLAIGLSAAFVAGRGLASQLFGVPFYDPLVFGAAAAILVASEAMAALIPAVRAARIEPVDALRAN